MASKIDGGGAFETCPGCGGSFPSSDGPVHAYMLSAPGCWERYGAVLAREYQDPELFAQTHRLTVDAYALQHPGRRDDRRAYQSVRIHYVSLHLIFAGGWPHDRVTRTLGALAANTFAPLPEPFPDFDVTVNHVWEAGRESHAEQVRAWAQHAYEAWDSLAEYAEEETQKLRAA
ncbi:MAG: DUF5946 family protein [Pseudomonadota bacterium]